MFSRTLIEFLRSESGVVTVDFVVLTGIVASFGIGVTLALTLEPSLILDKVASIRAADNNTFTAKFVKVDE